MAILKPEPNKPYEVALKYKKGTPKRGLNGEAQTQFVLVSGDLIYLPASVADEIASLNLGPHEPFILTKQPKGAWSVERKPQASPGPQLVKKAELMNELGTVIVNGLPVNGAGENPLRIALRAVIDEASDAEKYAASKGMNFRFSGEDVRAMVNTMCIGMQQAGR